jgi:hypothetical protein
MQVVEEAAPVLQDHVVEEEQEVLEDQVLAEMVVEEIQALANRGPRRLLLIVAAEAAVLLEISLVRAWKII